eukprot:CAMPEP_0115536934 /NCGR_PEP_ID=MMETSP0271-20121206/88048_1 /TAXON_ID=71861 /ORGANISM="Scrippsiella trochoidea, Strain CCMP3099" /LENGTH=70 /DNA_ID=CAMNT_0002969673 /DNA_START=182 /DNA_END=394 /DNA_ORIENTATION=-
MTRPLSVESVLRRPELGIGLLSGEEAAVLAVLPGLSAMLVVMPGLASICALGGAGGGGSGISCWKTSGAA